jgi:hypothetical protein
MTQAHEILRRVSAVIVRSAHVVRNGVLMRGFVCRSL